MIASGPHNWFTTREKTFLKTLQHQFPDLVTHVQNNRKRYTKYLDEALNIPHSVKATVAPTRELILMASQMALMFDEEIKTILALYDAETPKSRPTHLTEALSRLNIHVRTFGMITRTELKALFLLLAGVYTANI